MINAYRGEVAFDLAGKKLMLRYGWDGIARLKAEFGDEWDAVLVQAMAGTDMPAIAKFLAIGLRESWPDASAAEIERIQPPIRPSFEAIKLGLNLTFHGTKEPPAEPAANPPPGRLMTALRRISFWRD